MASSTFRKTSATLLMLWESAGCPYGAVRTYAAPLTAANTGVVGQIRISSYGPGDAERTVKDLRAAVTACRDGFPAEDGTVEKADVEKVTSFDAPKAGDEAVAFRLSDAGEAKAVIKFTMVRTGPQLTVFYAVNVVDRTESEVPAEVVDAQAAKVEKAGRAAAS